MPIRSGLTYITLVIIVLSTKISAAQTLDTKNLLEVRAAIADICGELLKEGESSETKVSGNAEAKLDGLLDRFADIGVEGAASIDKAKYLGVLRSDLLDERNAARDCRLVLWNDLKSSVITPAKTEARPREFYDFPETETKWLGESDLRTFSSRDLRLMRNEIYARYGYIFNSNDLKSYFSSKPWYSPRTSDAELAYSSMSAVERSNVLEIKREEARR